MKVWCLISYALMTFGIPLAKPGVMYRMALCGSVYVSINRNKLFLDLTKSFFEQKYSKKSQMLSNSENREVYVTYSCTQSAQT